MNRRKFLTATSIAAGAFAAGCATTTTTSSTARFMPRSRVIGANDDNLARGGRELRDCAMLACYSFLAPIRLDWATVVIKTETDEFVERLAKAPSS